MLELKQKALKAAATSLTRRGYELIDQNELLLREQRLRFALDDAAGDYDTCIIEGIKDANQSYRGDTADDEIPVARRKKDWRFLLAESAESRISRP